MTLRPGDFVSIVPNKSDQHRGFSTKEIIGVVVECESKTNICCALISPARTASGDPQNMLFFVEQLTKLPVPKGRAEEEVSENTTEHHAGPSAV
jgi:hypothetical protein